MAIETGLSPRYQIRTLTLEDIDFAKAIVSHSNVFHSPVWPVLMPENKTQRLYECFKAADYLMRHQIESGLSLGVFDTEYQYKQPESAATAGKVLWDFSKTDATDEELTAQMDFPLLSIAMSYDGFNHLDMEKMMPLIACLPNFATVYAAITELEPRDPKTWEATAPGQVLLRNATATRIDAEGLGLMKKLAWYLMRKSAAEGFRSIQIECLHDAVNHVWNHPPEPFRAETICSFMTDEYAQTDENGQKVYPMAAAKQKATRVFVNLVDGA